MTHEADSNMLISWIMQRTGGLSKELSPLETSARTKLFPDTNPQYALKKLLKDADRHVREQDMYTERAKLFYIKANEILDTYSIPKLVKIYNEEKLISVAVERSVSAPPPFKDTSAQLVLTQHIFESGEVTPTTLSYATNSRVGQTLTLSTESELRDFLGNRVEPRDAINLYSLLGHIQDKLSREGEDER